MHLPIKFLYAQMLKLRNHNHLQLLFIFMVLLAKIIATNCGAGHGLDIIHAILGENVLAAKVTPEIFSLAWNFQGKK